MRIIAAMYVRLRELGYVEGKTIVVDWRRSAGANSELRSLAIDRVRSKPDVIFVFGTPAARGFGGD